MGKSYARQHGLPIPCCGCTVAPLDNSRRRLAKFNLISVPTRASLKLLRRQSRNPQFHVLPNHCRCPQNPESLSPNHCSATMRFLDDTELHVVHRNEVDLRRLRESLDDFFDLAQQRLQNGRHDLLNQRIQLENETIKLQSQEVELVKGREDLIQKQERYVINHRRFQAQQQGFRSDLKNFEHKQTQLDNREILLAADEKALEASLKKLASDREELTSLHANQLEQPQQQHGPEPQPITQPVTTPGVRSLFIVGGYLLFVGLLVFHFSTHFMTSSQEPLRVDSFIESFYMTVVTTFTVGYGDIFPHTVGTKALCDALVIVGHWVPIIFTFWLHRIAHTLDQRFLSTVQSESLRRYYRMCFAICAILVSILSGVGGFYIFERDRIFGASHGSSSLSPSLSPSPSPSPAPALLGFSDVFHMSVMTVTTAGYGDVTFVTPAGRAFAIFWIPIAVTIFAAAMTFLTESFLDWCRGQRQSDS